MRALFAAVAMTIAVLLVCPAAFAQETLAQAARQGQEVLSQLRAGVSLPNPSAPSLLEKTEVATVVEATVNGSLTADVSSSKSAVMLVASGNVVRFADNVAITITGDGSEGHTETVWYQAKRRADGSWWVVVPASATGTGQCVAQAWAGVGQNVFDLASTTFSFSGVRGKVEVSPVDAAGCVTVTASGVQCGAGVAGVGVGMFPQGMAGLWYNLVPGANGTWSASIPLEAVDFAQGEYTFVPVVHDMSGTDQGLGAISMTVDLGGEKTVESTVDELDEYLWLGAWGGAVGLAWNVSFCVTDAAGQETWVQGTRLPNGSWSATMPASDLTRGSGSMVAYANMGDRRVVLGTDTFKRALGDRGTMSQFVQGYGSTTGYLVAVDVDNCGFGVFTGSQNNWQCLYYWPCTVGAAATPTPRGVFSIGNKGYYFDSYGSRVFYFTQFYKECYFHSICYWPTLEYPDAGNIQDARLGMHLSHGCVRLDLDNALWVQNTLPAGTTVVVY